MKKTLTRLACVGILASGTVGLMGTPAHAAARTRGDGFVTSRCQGSVRSRSTIDAGGKPVAEMVLYYSSANFGTYCAQVKSRDGNSHRLTVAIVKPPSFASDIDWRRRRATKGVGMKRSARSCVYVAWSADGKAKLDRTCGGYRR